MPGNMSTNPYSVEVEVLKYGPGDKITVTLKSNDPKRPLSGFFLQAVQANIHLRDLRRRAFGTFENTTKDERPSVCDAFDSVKTSGITHSNAKGRKSVIVTWIAPVEYNPGDIQFLATGVLDYYTYWTDIRSKVLVAEGFSKPSETVSSGSYAPTAAWYRWLQYLRQQQLLRRKLGLPIPAAQEGTDHMSPEHDHHHHHHDHAHDHAHDHGTQVTSLSQPEQSTQSNDTLNLATLLEGL